MPTLFDPIDVGAIRAPNRVFMAPLTRGRGTRNHIPTADMATYYAQRAGAGLIISEATGISLEGSGWPFAPGLWNDAQVEAWKPVTEAVHAAGGRIVAQLWHMGRLVHPSLNGVQPVSSSPTTAPGKAHTYDGKQDYVQPHALTLDEIARVTDDYAHAAANAVAAGFDGVQLHGANGYLIDQFLRDNANLRTDQYGGSVENRIRLLCDVTRALIDTVGAGRTGVRLSPNGETQGVDDSNPEAVFTAAAAALQALDVSFLELREMKTYGSFGTTTVAPLSPAIRGVFTNTLVLNQEYDRAKANADIASGLADAISFGRPFIANPDLVDRLRNEAPIAEADFRTWYSRGAAGYTDWPVAA